MSNHKGRWMGAWLASTLIALACLASASNASDTGDASKTVGFASIIIEGAPKGASFHMDSYTLNIPGKPGKAGPVVVKSGPHVFEVREGENVVFREEVTLKPDETRTLLVPKAE